jgi:hypothetical protein
MKALILATVLLASCGPVSSAPTPTPTPSGTLAATATVAAGLTRYANTELGYSVDLPPGWRRAVCSAGVVTTSPLVASEIFLPVPESEEYVMGGVRMVLVQVVEDRGLTPLEWLRGVTPADARVEPLTVGERTGARAFVEATGDTYALAFAARGWMYEIERTYFGNQDQEVERILATMRLLGDATVGRGASPTPSPRSIEMLVDSIADAFTRKDLAAIADTMSPCIAAGAVPGDPALLSRTAYVRSLAVEFAAGTSVRVQSRPIESDPNFGRFVRSTWSKPGEADQRVDLLLHAQGDRWSLGAVLIRTSPN